jgi:FtsP/CotA-like multicopper oxidase with cupredoxin domain
MEILRNLQKKPEANGVRRIVSTRVWLTATMFLISGLLMFLTFVPGVMAQSPTATTDHGAHHPTATPRANQGQGNATSAVTATATPGMPGMGGMMEGTPMHHMPGATTPTPGTNAGDTHGGHDMGPVDGSDAPLAPKDARGGQRLESKIVNGVKEFSLAVEKVRWNILPGVEVVAYAYNGTVPGPEIRVTEGDRVRILVANKLKEPTSVHWHGMQIPNDQDGAAGVTQPPIQPGETYTYEWTVPSTPGTFFYHTHFAADKQQALGLYGALIVEAKQPAVKYDVEYTLTLGEWTVKDGKTYPAMQLEGMQPNFFTFNGRSYPTTDTLKVKVGQRVLLRFIGSGQFIHPLHLHGQPFKIVATDGNPVPEAAQIMKDTLLIGPGERYDVEFVARAPGKWLLHCHINHHVTNDGVEIDGGGGMTMIVEVTA